MCFLSVRKKCKLGRRLMKVETFPVSSETRYITVQSQCYCLVFLGIIYLTLAVQRQTVMLISLMNMFK